MFPLLLYPVILIVNDTLLSYWHCVMKPIGFSTWRQLPSSVCVNTTHIRRLTVIMFVMPSYSGTVSKSHLFKFFFWAYLQNWKAAKVDHCFIFLFSGLWESRCMWCEWNFNRIKSGPMRCICWLISTKGVLDPQSLYGAGGGQLE